MSTGVILDAYIPRKYREKQPKPSIMSVEVICVVVLLCCAKRSRLLGVCAAGAA